MFDVQNLKEIKILKQTERQKISLVEDNNGIKYLRRDINEDKREIYKSLSNIDHPNIPKIFCVDLTDHTVVIEQYIDGTPLSEYIEKDIKFNRKQIKSIAVKLLSALEAIHRQNIIHRDIKPENVLIDKCNNVYLIDYDIARIERNQLKKDTDTMGTFGYAPIEQFGMMPTDAKTDIYAFGMTLKALLKFSEVKGYLHKIAEKCTRLDPSQRYRDAAAVKKALKLNSVKYVSLCAVLLVLGGCICLYAIPDKQIEETIVPDQDTIDIQEYAEKEQVKTEDNKPVKSEEKTVASRKDDPKTSNELAEEIEDGIFSGFAVGTLEAEYCKPGNTVSTGIFNTDDPYEHLIFVEDMNKKGKIKFGKSNSYVDADITLNNGVLSVSLDDGKGHTFNDSFMYDGTSGYVKFDDGNLRKNADIICHDFDWDGYTELLFGVNECNVNVYNKYVEQVSNYSVAWCIRYDEERGFVLCKGKMFNRYGAFTINSRFNSALHLTWQYPGDIMYYDLIDDMIVSYSS